MPSGLQESCYDPLLAAVDIALSSTLTMLLCPSRPQFQIQKFHWSTEHVCISEGAWESQLFTLLHAGVFKILWNSLSPTCLGTSHSHFCLIITVDCWKSRCWVGNASEKPPSSPDYAWGFRHYGIGYEGLMFFGFSITTSISSSTARIQLQKKANVCLLWPSLPLSLGFILPKLNSRKKFSL